MLDGEKKIYSLRKPFIVHLTLLFFISYIFFADQMLEFVCGFFLYANFVIYISISMVEIMWVRVNYKVMFIMVDRWRKPEYPG